MILNCIIHQPLPDTSEAFSSPWIADNYNSLYLKLCRGYACPIWNRSMVDMTRAWRMLDNEISMIPMPEEYNNFYVKVLDFVTVCCLFCFSYFFFVSGALPR